MFAADGVERNRFLPKRFMSRVDRLQVANFLVIYAIGTDFQSPDRGKNSVPCTHKSLIGRFRNIGSAGSCLSVGTKPITDTSCRKFLFEIDIDVN